MKAILRLALVAAIVLIVSSSAFANDCKEYCYEVTATDENGNTDTEIWYVLLCSDGTGSLYIGSDGPLSLYLFGGGPSWFNTSGDPMFGGKPFFTSWISTDNLTRAGYLQPSAGGLLLTGEGVSHGTRYTLSGKKLSTCPIPG